ncbi:MAG TPA: hypothetical protein VJK52_00925 [Candidatus Nanoarchaeia archaeon]|nr:hypothetical protein [Candidatus Nanoarchaeia archaeon]
MPAKKTVRSKGPEDILRDYFVKQHIAFLYKERKINLKPGLSKAFVLPDFYLPQYGLPVEYLHHWEDPKFRPRNMAKLELYAQADIPCIFIYPKDLEQIEAMFPAKLQEAQRHIALQQHDVREVRFSLMLAVICILLGVPLSVIRYTKYLGWIAIAYGVTLLIMRHPKLVMAVFKRTAIGTGKGLALVGKALLIFFQALGRGLARLLILIWRAIVISIKLIWKLTKLLSIYLWIMIKAVGYALWWILLHFWYGFLTTMVWLWHIVVLLSYRAWRLLRWLGLQFGKLLRVIARGFLLSLHAFGSGVAHAKEKLSQKSKERKKAYQEAIRAAKEATRVANQAARVAKGAKTAKQRTRKST